MLYPNSDIETQIRVQSLGTYSECKQYVVTLLVISFLHLLDVLRGCAIAVFSISRFKLHIKNITLLLLITTQAYSTDDIRLPDLGTPSDSTLSPIKEKEIRDTIINQIYEYDLVMLDPIIAAYMEQLGFKLAVHSDNPHAAFDFFIVNDSTINASAYPGGVIVFFSGLFLRTENESELAGVMAHEIAHATGRHLSRFYADVKKNTIPMLLGLVAAAVASQYSDSPDAPVAIAVATQGLQQQSMINFTRANEYEADRIGIKTLIKAGFNPLGMAGFFEKLMREKPIDERYHMPEYLRTHPLSINRVTEAKNRAQTSNMDTFTESETYQFVKERLRVFTKDIEIDNTNYYKKLFKDTAKDKITQAQIYGYALALYHAHANQHALDRLKTIQANNQTKLMIDVLTANIIAEIDIQASQKLFAKLYNFYPQSPIVIEPYIQFLSKSNTHKNKKLARVLARRLIDLYPERPNYYQLLAVVNQNLGKSIEANEALAVKEHKIHNNYKAVRILKNTLKGKLDYYQRARIEAKITQYENLITDKERAREISAERTGRRRH
ncbi:MAG: M48 family metalloprotease [Proteobacteria bacterium]|nr:M48 family metalloprotease [Pseudomonadota bacterium]